MHIGFSLVDYVIVVVYLAGITVAGVLLTRRQKTSVDYFLGGKALSWWTVGLSIVATETSTLTFISVPGLAYETNMHFLQLAIGYLIGRSIVTVLFIPAYYRGNLETAYDYLGKRFGISLRKFASSVFIVTRVLASGVRLFASAIPVHLITGFDYPTSILIIGIFTLIYTYLGGLRAVVAMDVIQLVVYLGGAGISMAIILNHLPGGWSEVVQTAVAHGVNKLEVFNTSWGGSVGSFLTAPYTLLGSLLGGTFLTMASHGTDQLLVQRLLSCKSQRESQRALMLNAGLIVVQFAFFLLLGLCLYAFYGGATLQQLGLSSPDEVFPRFIVSSLPTGIAGFVVAAVLASAMGSLSSSMSSLASSAYLDLFKEKLSQLRFAAMTELRWSRLFTAFWGIVLIAGAMLFTDTRNPVVELGLKIASFTYGGLLGTFLLGILFKFTTERDGFVGFTAGIVVMSYVVLFTHVDFTWHTLIGCLTTIIAGNVSHKVWNATVPPERMEVSTIRTQQSEKRGEA